MRDGSPILRGLASTTPLLIALVGCGSNSATQQGSIGGSGAGGMGVSKASGGSTALGGAGGAGAHGGGPGAGAAGGAAGDKGGRPAGGTGEPGAGGGGAPGNGGGPSGNGGGPSGTGGTGIGGGVAGAGGRGAAAGSPGGASGAAGGASGGRGGVAGALGAGGGAGGSSNLPGGVEWEPWPSVPAVSADVCQVALVHGGDARSAPVPLDVEIREFTPATGIMKSQFAAFGSQPASVAYTVFTAQGYGVGGCNVAVTPYGCTEWVRDTHGNVTATDSPAYSDQNFTLSLLDASRFGTRAHGNVQTRYTVTYDAAGTLASGRNSSCCGDSTRTFTEDAQHRCSDVLWEKIDDAGGTPTGTSELEHWTWEGYRLVSRVTTNGADPNQVRSVVTYAYDAAGILATTVVDGYASLPQGNSNNAVPDGITDYLVRTVALADGSRWVEALDFHYYMPDANVVRAGKLTPAGRLRWNFSPGCRDVHPPRRTSTTCQFEPVQNQLGVRWDDPYTTPIRR